MRKLTLHESLVKTGTSIHNHVQKPWRRAVYIKPVQKQHILIWKQLREALKKEHKAAFLASFVGLPTRQMLQSADASQSLLVMSRIPMLVYSKEIQAYLRAVTFSCPTNKANVAKCVLCDEHAYHLK